MKRLLWVMAILLPLFASGCMVTARVSHDVGRNLDDHPRYTAIYSDGYQLVVSYTGYWSPASPRRWAEIDLRGMQWSPLESIGSTQAIEFMPIFEALKSGKIDGMKEISRYAAAYPNPEAARPNYANTGINAVDYNQIVSGTAHRNDPNRLPFTAYLTEDWHGILILIRDDPDHPGQFQALKLVPKQDLNPRKRNIIIPFAVAIDIVTFPLQALYGAYKLLQMAANH